MENSVLEAIALLVVLAVIIGVVRDYLTAPSR
jgi:hypothetical protein